MRFASRQTVRKPLDAIAASYGRQPRLFLVQPNREIDHRLFHASLTCEPIMPRKSPLLSDRDLWAIDDWQIDREIGHAFPFRDHDAPCSPLDMTTTSCPVISIA